MTEKECRPWGWFQVLDRGEDYCVKKIYVEPEMRLSLQFHRHRTEDWIVVGGSGLVTQGNCETECYRGDKFFIGIVDTVLTSSLEFLKVIIPLIDI